MGFIYPGSGRTADSRQPAGGVPATGAAPGAAPAAQDPTRVWPKPDAAAGQTTSSLLPCMLRAWGRAQAQLWPLQACAPACRDAQVVEDPDAEFGGGVADLPHPPGAPRIINVGIGGPGDCPGSPAAPCLLAVAPLASWPAAAAAWLQLERSRCCVLPRAWWSALRAPCAGQGPRLPSGGEPGATKSLPAVVLHQPDLILVSAGFDAHRREDINHGFVGLQERDYAWLTDQIVQAGARLASCLCTPSCSAPQPLAQLAGELRRSACCWASPP